MELLTVTKAGVLLVFFLFYCGVFYWTFRKKNQGKFEEYRRIPLSDD